jgi:site-specific DNA recombinase
MKIGIYVRVSSMIQITEGDSIDNQIDRGIEFCKRKGYEYEVFKDLGKSGGSIDSRLDYQRLFQMVQKGLIDGVWVFSLSRLNRDSMNQLLLIKECKENGVQLYVSGVEYDFNDPNDKLMLSILSVFDEHFREQNTFNIIKGKQNLLRKGKIVTTHQLFGYDINEDRTEISINKVESKILKRIIKWGLEDKSCLEISNLLKLEYGDTILNDRGKPYSWRRVWVWKLLVLKDHYWKGELEVTVEGEGNVFRVPKLVDHKDIERIRYLIPTKKKHKRDKPLSHLEDKMVCGYCGSNVVLNGVNRYKKVDGVKEKIGKHWYWRCSSDSNSLRKRTKNCNNIHKKMDLVELDILQILNQLRDNNGLVSSSISDVIQQKHRGNFKPTDQQKNDKKTHKSIKKESLKIERLREMFVEGDIDKPYFKQKKRDIEKKVELLKKELLPIDSLDDTDYEKVRDLLIEIFSSKDLEVSEFIEMYVDRIEMYCEKKINRQNKILSYSIKWKGVGIEDSRFVEGESIEFSEENTFSLSQKSYVDKSTVSNGVRNPHKLSYHIQTLLFIENEEVSMIDVRVEK